MQVTTLYLQLVHDNWARVRMVSDRAGLGPQVVSLVRSEKTCECRLAGYGYGYESFLGLASRGRPSPRALEWPCRGRAIRYTTMYLRPTLQYVYEPVGLLILNSSIDEVNALEAFNLKVAWWVWHWVRDSLPTFRADFR